MGLKKRETNYFNSLVYFNDAKTLDQRIKYFEELKSRIPKGTLKELRESQYVYFSNWYNLVIRELVDMYDFKEDYAELGKK